MNNFEKSILTHIFENIRETLKSNQIEIEAINKRLESLENKVFIPSGDSCKYVSLEPVTKLLSKDMRQN